MTGPVADVPVRAPKRWAQSFWPIWCGLRAAEDASLTDGAWPGEPSWPASPGQAGQSASDGIGPCERDAAAMRPGGRKRHHRAGHAMPKVAIDGDMSALNADAGTAERPTG